MTLVNLLKTFVLGDGFKSLNDTKYGPLALKTVHAVLIFCVILYLVNKLWGTDWADIVSALPKDPTFFVLFLLLYILTPLSECFAYRITWSFDALASLAAFIKKRIYNKDFFGYSGEVYFYLWAQENIDLPKLEVFKTIRDQNIISSLASTVVATILVSIFLFTGEIKITDWLNQRELLILATIVIVFCLPIILFSRLRHVIFSMAYKTAAVIFGLHLVRLLIGQTLQIGMWAIAMPEVGLSTWLTFASASIVISRFFFIPNRDLIFLGVGVSLSKSMGLSETHIFALFASIAVLNKVSSLLLFTALSILDRRRISNKSQQYESWPD